jgi:hypothetical protein
LAAADPVAPDALHDRAADNWRPLLAIADRAGADWPEMARDAARALSSDDGDSDQQEAGIRLLADCKAIFEEKAVEALQPQQLVIALQQIEESPWSERRHGRPVTARSVARLLKPLRHQELRADPSLQRREAALLYKTRFRGRMEPLSVFDGGVTGQRGRFQR